MLPLTLLLALQLADWLTTRTGLKRGRKEANPAVAWLFENFGVDLTLAFKTAFVMLVGWLITPWWWAIWGLVAIYAAVVGWNLWLLWKGR